KQCHARTESAPEEPFRQRGTADFQGDGGRLHATPSRTCCQRFHSCTPFVSSKRNTQEHNKKQMSELCQEYVGMMSGICQNGGTISRATYPTDRNKVTAAQTCDNPTGPAHHLLRTLTYPVPGIGKGGVRCGLKNRQPLSPASRNRGV